MNRIVLSGRTTADIELKMTTEGTPVASFSLAVRRTAEITDFFDVVAWKKTAEIVSKYTRKGDRVLIYGSLQRRAYEDKDKKKRYVFEIKADEVELIEPKKKEEPLEVEKTTDAHFEDVPDDEDLPF